MTPREILVPVHIVERARSRAATFAPNRFTEEMPGPEVLACATIGECAVGFELDDVPMEITVESPPDIDKDIEIAGKNIEVKNLDAGNKHLLIYPRKKGLGELVRRRCEMLVLTRCTREEPRRCLILGWISKYRFLKTCLISGCEPRGRYVTGLWLGTPYVHEAELDPIGSLERILKEGPTL